MEIVEKVKELVSDYLADHNIELVDMVYRRESGGMMLRLLVDTPEGITLGECEALNKYLGETLDKEDIINERYTIEVSSPGLDRPFKTDRDFERALGREIEITTFAPIDDRKTHEGKLVGMDKDNIVVKADDISVVIPKDKIALARLKVGFSQ